MGQMDYPAAPIDLTTKWTFSVCLDESIVVSGVATKADIDTVMITYNGRIIRVCSKGYTRRQKEELRRAMYLKLVTDLHNNIKDLSKTPADTVDDIRERSVEVAIFIIMRFLNSSKDMGNPAPWTLEMTRDIRLIFTTGERTDPDLIDLGIPDVQIMALKMPAFVLPRLPRFNMWQI